MGTKTAEPTQNVQDAWNLFIRSAKDTKGAKECVDVMTNALADVALDIGSNDPRFSGIMYSRNLLKEMAR